MATDIQKVRLLIPDTEAAFDGQTMFEDADIEGYLEISSGNVLRAAAYAIYAVASSEALISKIIKTQDLSTNGAGVSDALVKKGDALMKRADKIELDESTAFYFNIVDNTLYTTPELTEFSIPNA